LGIIGGPGPCPPPVSAPGNNLLFLSLQRCHTICMNTLFGSFRFGAGCSRLKCVHRCCKERVLALKEQLQPREFITPHQICLVKEQWTRMWTLVCFSWSQRRQCSCASSPCQRRLSAVQILHLMGHGQPDKEFDFGRCPRFRRSREFNPLTFQESRLKLWSRGGQNIQVDGDAACSHSQHLSVCGRPDLRWHFDPNSQNTVFQMNIQIQSIDSRIRSKGPKASLYTKQISKAEPTSYFRA